MLAAESEVYLKSLQIFIDKEEAEMVDG